MTEAAESQTYADRVVRLADLAIANFIIARKEFRNCLILGPAIVVPLGETSFVNCAFDSPPEVLFWEVPREKEMVVGAIGLQDCAFRECRFQAIGMAGPRELLDMLRSGLAEVGGARGGPVPA